MNYRARGYTVAYENVSVVTKRGATAKPHRIMCDFYVVVLSRRIFSVKHLKLVCKERH
jgi:hypothetical protein